MIIDATELFHTIDKDALAWRDGHIVPLYNDAGIEKFAFLVTDVIPGTVEEGGTPGPGGPATFPTAWFETREHIYGWLAS